MPEKTTTVSTEKAVVSTGDHDRVVGLSIDKEGKPDQSAGFEVIGDKDAAVAAAK